MEHDPRSDGARRLTRKSSPRLASTPPSPTRSRAARPRSAYGSALGATNQRVVRQIVGESLRVIAAGAMAAPGSGLGLAIVRDLAELYGGSISLESSPTGGLRARLQLPAC